MTSSVRILTTYALDSSPAVLLISPNGDKTLVNCGEGCQRSFLESPGLRVRSVTRVCLTHIGHDAVGGLPGMVLTTADVAVAAAAANAVQNERDEVQKEAGEKRKDHPTEEITPDLDIIGPVGTQSFLHSLRHFMRRDKFHMRVKEGLFKQATTEDSSIIKRKSGKRGRKREGNDYMVGGFYVQTIPLRHTRKRGSSLEEKQVLSFIFTTPPVPGQFLPGKARDLGIPPGPLYGKLKAGSTVSFVDKSGVERTVESSEVVAKGSPGVAVVVIYCPSISIFAQLKASQDLVALQTGAEDAPKLDVMVHLSPHDIFHCEEYVEWRKAFSDTTDHIWIETYEYIVDVGKREANVIAQASPFRAAVEGAKTRSLLNSNVFPPPISPRQSLPDDTSDITVGSCTNEYVLIPRSKRGLRSLSFNEKASSPIGPSDAEWEVIRKAAGEMDGMSLQATGHSGELLFTGTGSALPCKHRNVTGMFLGMRNGNAMLLDVGEGTVGQLLRSKQTNMGFGPILNCIKAVWISHPHADHHLGLLRLLSERSAFGLDPIVLIAPPNLFRFLSEYCEVDTTLKGSYVPLDCRDIVKGKRNPLGEKLHADLGITSCVSVPVAHCPNSFAVVIDGTAFGRVAYSGDCRPSLPFAEAGKDADLLIHEATFEDGMEEEAVLKKHCTVGEAMSIAHRMRAKAVALTHFSQRYPRIPKLEVSMDANCAVEDGRQLLNTPVAFAFDYMRITPANIGLASTLTPSLRLLYPADDESIKDPDDDTPESNVTASEILSVPGIFARQELL